MKRWINTKTEMGGGKNWDFVNGYYGEKKHHEETYKQLLARITDSGKQIKRSSGVECFKIESRNEGYKTNYLEKA